MGLRAICLKICKYCCASILVFCMYLALMGVTAGILIIATDCNNECKRTSACLPMLNTISIFPGVCDGESDYCLLTMHGITDVAYVTVTRNQICYNRDILAVSRNLKDIDNEQLLASTHLFCTQANSRTEQHVCFTSEENRTFGVVTNLSALNDIICDLHTDSQLVPECSAKKHIQYTVTSAIHLTLDIMPAIIMFFVPAVMTFCVLAALKYSGKLKACCQQCRCPHNTFHETKSLDRNFQDLHHCMTELGFVSRECADIDILHKDLESGYQPLVGDGDQQAIQSETSCAIHDHDYLGTSSESSYLGNTIKLTETCSAKLNAKFNRATSGDSDLDSLHTSTVSAKASSGLSGETDVSQIKPINFNNGENVTHMKHVYSYTTLNHGNSMFSNQGQNGEDAFSWSELDKTSSCATYGDSDLDSIHTVSTKASSGLSGETDISQIKTITSGKNVTSVKQVYSGNSLFTNEGQNGEDVPSLQDFNTAPKKLDLDQEDNLSKSEGNYLPSRPEPEGQSMSL